MANVLLMYASMTGNTELMAEIIVEYIEKRGVNIDTRTFHFDPIDVEGLADYDAMLIGTHTWYDGDLSYEVEDFYEELDDVDISGMLCGVFGSGDSFYDSYGGAVDIMWKHLQELGATLVPQRLKVDLQPDQEDVCSCQHFAGTFCDMLEYGGITCA